MLAAAKSRLRAGASEYKKKSSRLRNTDSWLEFLLSFLRKRFETRDIESNLVGQFIQLCPEEDGKKLQNMLSGWKN